MTLQQIQSSLIALGYDLGKGGPSGKGDDGVYGANTERAILAFQKAGGLQGDVGAKTISLLDSAVAAKKANDVPPAAARVIPADWMPGARMQRIIMHWTAGGHKASAFDREHYHILIESDGKLVRGIPTIDKNDAGGIKPGYAAHCLNANTGSIGVSLCCMAGAVESPFKSGNAPMTQAQFNQLARVVDELCSRYGIDVTPRTVLWHAEVQGTLGIKQNGKWDASRLSFDPSVIGAKACGDKLRALATAI